MKSTWDPGATASSTQPSIWAPISSSPNALSKSLPKKIQHLLSCVLEIRHQKTILTVHSLEHHLRTSYPINLDHPFWRPSSNLPRSAMRPRPQEPHDSSRAAKATCVLSALLRCGATGCTIKSLTLAHIGTPSGMENASLNCARHKPSSLQVLENALIRCGTHPLVPSFYPLELSPS
jgi:hypothetical protein